MQGGLKACPQCGSVNDADKTTCGRCGYNFSTGEAGTEIPRILADDANIIKRAPQTGRVIGVAVVALTVLVFGFVAFIFLQADSEVGPISTPFEVDIPEMQPIEIPTVFDEGRDFDRASCTRTLSRSLERLVRAQAKDEPLNDLFAEFTSFGVGSFEYRTLVQVFTGFEIQSALVNGEVSQAVRMAELEATSACRKRYAR